MKKKIAKHESETALERKARLWLNSRGEDYEDGAKGAARDLFYGGCQSGIVGDLIYYHDTQKFYQKHSEEIAALLAEAMSDWGVSSPKEVFSAWDDTDPLANDTSNQNLLAWFGFEEAARRVCDRAGIEI